MHACVCVCVCVCKCDFFAFFPALSTSSEDCNFVRCPASVLGWEKRKDALLQQIKTVSADIICLEEVDHFHDFFQPQLEALGYQGTFHPKTHSPCLNMDGNNGPDGCALFYRSSVFDMRSERKIVLEDANGKQTNQVALLQQLKVVDSDGDGTCEGVCVAVTHLKSKPSSAALRVHQGKSLLAALADWKVEYPMLVCGDFNADPDEEVLDVFQEHKPKFHQVYPSSSEEFTTWKFRPGIEVCHTIDYILYEAKRLSVLSRLALPSKAEIGPDGLPSSVYPSDHLALACDVRFRRSA